MTPTFSEMACFHEAAHAVTAEALFPGGLKEIVMRPTPELREEAGLTANDEAWVTITDGHMVATSRPDDYAAMVYAGKWAEREIGWTALYSTAGDLMSARRLLPNSLRRARASRRARALVRRHWDAIERLADVLSRVDVMSGDEARAVIGFQSERAEQAAA